MARDSGGGDFELAPEGNHLARCYQVVDLGIQTVTFNNEQKEAHKVLFGWELPATLMEDGKPFFISARYTVSLHEKSNLRGQLQSWRGRSFTEDELAGFDLYTVLGVPCMLNVVHNNSNGRTYANISAITPIPQGMSCPAAVNAPLRYAIDEHTDAEFQALPAWMRNTINGGSSAPTNGGTSTPVQQTTQQPVQKAATHDDFIDDDIPF